MPRQENTRTWYAGTSSRHAPIGESNVGRKMLEKMGWSNGLGLGRDNQGIKEHLSYRHKVCKTGLRSKDEIGNEVLPHQSAFDGLLGELNATVEETQDHCANVNTSRSYKRQIRYVKMARAKDVANYAEKDLEGILGKGAAKRNLNKQSNEMLNYNSNVFDISYTKNVTENLSEIMSKKTCFESGGNMDNQDYPLENCELEGTNRDVCNDSSNDHIHLSKSRKSKKRKNADLELNSTVNALCELENRNTNIAENGKAEKFPNLLGTTDSHSVKINNETPKKSKSDKKKAKSACNNSVFVKKNVTSEKDVQRIQEPTTENKSEIISNEQVKKWKKEIVNYPEIVSEMCSGFVGSNLQAIKGYGNW